MAASLDGTDRALVAAFLRDRGEIAFRQLYRRHTPRLLRLSRRLAWGLDVGADDIVQEAWIRAMHKLDRFEGRSSLATWLGGIVVNIVREHSRRPPRQTVDGADPRSEWTDPIADLSIVQCLRDLPPGFRSVVALHDIAGFTHDEIAGLLGIDPGTSKSQLARARQRLRRTLGAETDGKS